MPLYDKFCPEYITGVTTFMNVVSNHTREDGKARCPCRRCRNLFWCSLSDIQNHLYEHGIDVTYKRWTCHGENLPISSSMLSRSPINPSSVGGSCSRERQTLGEEDREILEDLHPELFEVNVEARAEHQHSIPRQEAEEDINISINDGFERLLRDAQSDVYPGCKKYSLLSVVIKLLHMKILGKWSNNSFN